MNVDTRESRREWEKRSKNGGREKKEMKKEIERKRDGGGQGVEGYWGRSGESAKRAHHV
jgi:hypothetical protein